MNGLANAILTLLLGWLRSIVDRVWSLINSDSGSRFLGFLSENWLTILLVLGAGGFVLDKIIYLIRWRPFSVRRRRREQQELAESGDGYWPQQPAYPQAVPAAASAYAPAPVQEAQPPVDQPVAWDAPSYDVPEPAADQTAVYSRPVVDHNAYRPPLESIDPVFDDQAAWADSDALVNEPVYSQPVSPAAPPVSERYLQDVQAGFARPVSPEQMYAQPQPSPTPETAEPIEALQVHPGLDEELFRRSMGLSYSDEPLQDPENQYAVNFTPFTKKAEPEQPAKKNRNPFLNLMRLVGDDAAKPSIHDLQNSVDVREAFREPVYPKPLYRNEDDPS